MAGWEIASWTLACFVALVLLAAAIQRANDDRQWNHVTPRVQTTTTCVRGGCLTRTTTNP